MLRNKLAEIMAIKKLKISDMHRDTGLARSTIKPIYDNTSNAVSFDVIDRICVYLKVHPGELFEFMPMSLKIDVSIDYIKGDDIQGYVNISFSNYDKTSYCFWLSFLAEVSADDALSITLYKHDEAESEGSKPDFSFGFLSQIEDEILTKVVNAIEEQIEGMIVLDLIYSFDHGGFL